MADDDRIIIEDVRAVSEEEPAQQSKSKDVEERDELDLDFYQAALFFATTEGDYESLVFRTWSKVGRVVSRSLSQKDVAPRKMKKSSQYARYRMLFVVSFMLIVQVCLMHQLLFSVRNRSCSSSAGCVRGTSCTSHRRARRTHVEGRHCESCDRLADGNETRKVEDLCFRLFDDKDLLRSFNKNENNRRVTVRYGDAKNRFGVQKYEEVRYASSVFVDLCAGCIDVDGTYKPLPNVVKRNVRAMRAGDFITLLVCSLAVALAVAGEVRDVKIATMAQKRIFYTASAEWNRKVRVAHIWFAVVNHVRLYVLVPQVVAAVPNLVVLEGGDAVAVLFNTVAVVFVVEIDNLLSTRLLSARTLKKVRELAVVRADAADHRYLSVTQKLYVAGVIFLVFFGVSVEAKYADTKGASFSLALSGALLAGLVEVVLYADLPLIPRVLVATEALQDLLYYCCCCFFCCRCSCCCCFGSGGGGRRRRSDAFSATASSSSSRGTEKEEDEEAPTDQPPIGRTVDPPQSTSSLRRRVCGSHMAHVPATRVLRKPLTRPFELVADLGAFTLEVHFIVLLPITILNSVFNDVWES